jgi:hypothetical protein
VNTERVSAERGAGDRPSTGQPPTGRPSSGRSPRSGDEPETAAERRLINILIVGFILFVLGAGLWLGDALLQSRQMDECMSSGRRNCAPITVPPPPPQR